MVILKFHFDEFFVLADIDVLIAFHSLICIYMPGNANM